MVIKKDPEFASIAKDAIYTLYYDNAKLGPIPYKRLNKCNAIILTLKDRHADRTYYVLQSYGTIVAAIACVRGVARCVSFANIAYGKQTATTTQHIHKFMKLYSVEKYYHD